MSAARPPGESSDRAVRLGMRANLGQFLLLVGVSALIGATVGQERAILRETRDHARSEAREGEGGRT